MSLHYRLLDDRLIRYRDAEGASHHATLPELFVAFGQDAVRDFPALRPHQRHPWHAFLVQLAAIALHAAQRTEPFDTADEWRAALLGLTPDHPDGAAFSLAAPDDRPALLQPPCEPGESRTWKKKPLSTPDALDMLITSRNHDVKAAAMMNARPEDWLYALISLQTQEGFLGAGNYGISRMNGGFASRPAFGAVPAGRWGRRWSRDTRLLLEHREKIIERYGFTEKNGLALVWLRLWDGSSSVSFAELDPFYIEVCRRVRLDLIDGKLHAFTTTSKTTRIAAKERLGATGDAWTPVAEEDGKALSITARGFDYKLLCNLAFTAKFVPTITRDIRADDGDEGIVLLAQAVTRGKGKTEGYHERRIRVSPAIRQAFRENKTDRLAHAASVRIEVIGNVRKVLWSALCALFSNGEMSSADEVKNKADRFARPFEQAEDRRFFEDLIEEIEGVTSAEQNDAHDKWLADVADRAEQVLNRAFVAGPRASVRRYRAQSAALSRFHSGLRRKAGERMGRVLGESAAARKPVQAAMKSNIERGST